jgi:hypothetical protein
MCNFGRGVFGAGSHGEEVDTNNFLHFPYVPKKSRI